jgi:hypothetical protein
MPGPEFHVPTERIESFEYALELFGARAQDPEPILQRIVDKLLERERRMFETRGASSGVYWQPLKPSTVARKGGTTFHHQRAGERSAYPERPLWRSGDLMRSLSERGAKHQILNVNKDGFTLGTTHEAAAIHADGRGVPRRPPLVVPKKHAHEYIGMLNDFIFGGSDA